MTSIHESITRKQHVLCFVLPKYIREGTSYRFMKIEQMMEYTHALFNELESTRKSEKNRAKRFFQMIQAKENMCRSDKKNFAGS